MGGLRLGIEWSKRSGRYNPDDSHHNRSKRDRYGYVLNNFAGKEWKIKDVIIAID